METDRWGQRWQACEQGIAIALSLWRRHQEVLVLERTPETQGKINKTMTISYHRKGLISNVMSMLVPALLNERSP